MLPFGSSKGDKSINSFDDAQHHIELKKSMPLFAKQGRSLYVSRNCIVNLCKAVAYRDKKSFDLLIDAV